MISDADNKIVHVWAKNGQNLGKVLSIGDALKGVKSGKTLAILAPSYLMRKINYKKVLEDPNVDTMGVNNVYHMPGSLLLNYYLPFTTINATQKVNNDPKYLAWMNNYRGLVMHGVHHNDGSNTHAPYPLASLKEAQYIISKCPNTKFTIWHHSWGDYLAKKGVKGMLEFPHFEHWTPRKLPWAHCGAISGFAIPMAMALGYSRIYVIGMGFMHVINGWHNPPPLKTKPLSQANVKDPWFHVAPTRFKNQADVAKKNNILLKVGPSNIIEPALKQWFDTFNTIGDII